MKLEWQFIVPKRRAGLLILSGGRVITLLLSSALKPLVCPTILGKLPCVTVPVTTTVFGTRGSKLRQLIAINVSTRTPVNRSWDCAWPVTTPLFWVALKEKVISLPLTVKSPLPLTVISPRPVVEAGLAPETSGTKPRATIANANKPTRTTVGVVMMIPPCKSYPIAPRP